jgi:hypothetical protein
MKSPLLIATATALLNLPVQADIIFTNGFETPSVTGRTCKADGGDITKTDPAKPGGLEAWSRFEDQPNIGEGGSVVAGLTKEVAHTGTQSLFIEAAKLSAPYIGALFATRPIPVESGKSYRATLWGRNDPKKPLISGAAQLFLKVQVDFFTDEGKTDIGESQYLLQPLPGGRGHVPVFRSDAWNCVGMRFTAPPEAKYVTISFRCDSSAERGAISGTIYFDDFTLETAMAVPPPPDSQPEQIEKEIEALNIPDTEEPAAPAPKP